MAIRGTTEDWSLGGEVNLETIEGVSGNIDAIVSGSSVGGISHGVFLGRAETNGTISIDATVGASGEDLYLQWHEFDGVTSSTTFIGSSGVFENGSIPSGRDVAGGTGTDPNFAGSVVTSNGADRLGITMMALASNQATSSWTGETGGDFTEATEFQSATGSTATLQLQTASLATPTTVADGTQTLGASTDWVICFFALNPRDTGLAWITA
jgi:hypothetical protein